MRKHWYSPFTNRIQYWWLLVWRGWWKPMLVIWALIGSYDLVAQQLFPQFDLPSIAELTYSRFPIFGWRIWAVIALLLLLLATLEGAYRKKKAFEAQITKLETELERPKLFDILCPTITLGLPINKLDNGSYRASAAGVSPSPLQILHRGELTTVNRFTMTPRVLLILKDDKGWQTTTDITLLPSSNPLASSRTRDLSWDNTNPDQWVLTGLPLTLAKDEPLTLPMIMISVKDGNEVGSRLDKGETCKLTMSFGIFTDKGSPLLPDQQISLTRRDIKDSVYPIPEKGAKQ